MSVENEDEQQRENQSFRKVDKRHAAEPAESAEAAGDSLQEELGAEASEAAGEGVAEETTEPAEGAEPERVSLAELSVYDTLRFTIGLLAQQAWIHLGIQLAPGADDLKEDLPQARVAIDTLDFVVEKLQPELGDAEKSELSSVLANLRLNYVRKAE